jgi:23S rRNA (adenine2503-C2)-methyltransferase
MLPLQALTPEAIVAHASFVPLDEARKMTSDVHRGKDPFASRSGVSRATTAWAREHAHLPTLNVREELRSAVDPFIKLALDTHDGRIIETVRIPLEKPGRFSVCVSSQIGCALACAFCATGRMGLIRNLEAWEIVEQVRIVKRTLGARERVHGVVFQGMGEPMANLDRVLQAIAVLREPAAGQIDARNITVCTSGLPDGILRLAKEAPKVRLGISFGSARPEARKAIMPIDRAHPLDLVLEAAEAHVAVTGLAPMWAVTLLAGTNDSKDDALALAARAKRFHARTGQKPRLSIIAYNSIGDEDPFTRSENEQTFRDVLHEEGFPTHRRYSGGSDVAAACGQLARRRD